MQPDETSFREGRTQRSFDEVIEDWVRRTGAEPVLHLLPDDELLALCNGQKS